MLTAGHDWTPGSLGQSFPVNPSRPAPGYWDGQCSVGSSRVSCLSRTQRMGESMCSQTHSPQCPAAFSARSIRPHGTHGVCSVSQGWGQASLWEHPWSVWELCPGSRGMWDLFAQNMGREVKIQKTLKWTSEVKQLPAFPLNLKAAYLGPAVNEAAECFSKKGKWTLIKCLAITFCPGGFFSCFITVIKKIYIF